MFESGPAADVREHVTAGPSDSITGQDLRATDYESLAGFRTHVRRFFAFSEAATKAAGVENRHYQAMLAIKVGSEAAPLTITGFARHLQIQLNSAVELVGRMEAAGLVHRARAAADGRRIELTLTAQGAAMLETLARLHLKHHREHIAELMRHMSSVGPGEPGA